MSNHDDLQTVIDQLRAHRPEATALELDAIKQRVRARAGEPARRRRRRTELMKSRLVILTMLVLGMLLSTAGAGLAVSGLSGNKSASTAAYPTTSPSATPTGTPSATPTSGGGGVLGDQDQGAGQNVSPEDTGGGGNGPSGGNGPGGGSGNATQPARQVEAGAGTSGSSLPFTGFAAIPILFGGLVLLGGGLVLRSRAGEH
jgi:hypothetical protein